MKVPRFQVDRTLGSGSTGEVLHGKLLEDFGGLASGSEIAVKYLHASLTDEKRATQAFEREAETALTVRSDGLVRAVAAGKDERGPFIIMEYVPGHTLREVLEERGPLPEPTLRSVATQVVSGLAALHEAGYIHGDVKPENIRLDSDGRAVLVDLGFARRPGIRASATSKSLSSLAVSPAAAKSGSRAAGTLHYLAPERLRGEPGRASSDIFALGLVLYELATGLHPFASRTRSGGSGTGSSRLSRSSQTAPRKEPDVQRIVERVLSGELHAASTLDPVLSPFLDTVLSECLETELEKRPTANELLRIFSKGEASNWWRERIDFEATAREAGRARHHLTPLVGRNKDLARIRALADRTFDKSGSVGGTVLWFEGALGAGKTRLARELVSRLRSRQEPPLFLYGRSMSMRENRPCQPLLRMLQRYLGLPRNGLPGERDREHLCALVPPREAETLLRALNPHGVEGTPVSVPAALASWLIALGERHTALLFLDDLHHADAETLRALTLTAGRLDSTRMVAIFAVGTDETPRHAKSLDRLGEQLSATSRYEALKLENLAKDDVQALVATLFDHQAPRLRLGSVLYKRSQGHPGFLAEILRGMVGRGDMRPSRVDEGMYSLTVHPSELPRPATMHRAILESFRALPPGDRAWLQRFAVVGRSIETEFLLQAFPSASHAELSEVLGTLVRSNWLVPDGNRFRFARPAARESIYLSISPTRRKHLHASAANALKPVPGTPIKIASAFHRAFHLRAAEQFEELLLVLRPLVQRLASSGMPQRVWRLSRWGLEAIEALDAQLDPATSTEGPERRPLQLELLEHAADAANSLGIRANQRELLDRLSAQESSPDSDESRPEEMGRLYLLHGRYAASTGQNGLARGWFINAANLFETAGSQLLLSDTLRRLSLVQALVGELPDADKRARAALAAAGADPMAQALARMALSTVRLLEDELEPALNQTNRAMTLLRQVEGESVGRALAQGYILRARIYRSLGRPVRALGAASRALQQARRCGERLLEAEAGARLGGALLYTNRVEEAEARLRDARLLADEVEDKNGQALASLFLGVLLAEDDRAETRKRLEDSTRLAAQAGLHRIEALSLAIEARLDRQEGYLDRAQGCAIRALYLTGHYGAELFDRVVIEGTAVLLAREFGEVKQASDIERRLRRRLKRESARLGSDVLRRRHRAAAGRLLESVLSKDGPLYPRLRNVEAP